MGNLIVLKPDNGMMNYQYTTEKRVCYKTDKPAEGGVLLWYQGHPYPEKLFAYPEAFLCLDPVKRSIVNSMKLIKESHVAKFWLFWICLMPGHNNLMKKAARQYFNFTWNSLSKITYKPEFFCKAGRELYRAGVKTISDLDKTGKWIETGTQMIGTLVTIFEFDNAYRYRAQDWFEILDQKLFIHNPIRALWKMFDEASKRDTGVAEGKWKMFKWVMCAAMLNRNIRRIITTFINNLNFEELAMDIGDKYWCYHFSNYNVGGFDLDTRMAMRKDMWEKGMKELQKAV